MSADAHNYDLQNVRMTAAGTWLRNLKITKVRKASSYEP